MIRYENPKTLRHMLNRLRSLGYKIRSERLCCGEWSIELTTGQTICFREGGTVSLAPFQRDRRLERLFNIEVEIDQVAYPLS
jgi:hypothetical protein